jgi:endonuclease YncB( thermonuclease family)
MPDRQEQFSGEVVAIADGDTLSVLQDGKAVKVRLHGIDTPEKAQSLCRVLWIGHQINMVER